MSGKRNSKGASKKNGEDDYIPNESGNDEYDQIIENLEQSINKNRKRQSPTSDKLKITDYEVNEAEETPKRAKKQKVVDEVVKVQELVENKISKKSPKVWVCAEAALLRLLLTGFSPIGRNVAGMISLRLFLLFARSLSVS